jgi:hypothetical protein
VEPGIWLEGSALGGAFLQNHCSEGVRDLLDIISSSGRTNATSRSGPKIGNSGTLETVLLVEELLVLLVEELLVLEVVVTHPVTCVYPPNIVPGPEIVPLHSLVTVARFKIPVPSEFSTLIVP